METRKVVPVECGFSESVRLGLLVEHASGIGPLAELSQNRLLGHGARGVFGKYILHGRLRTMQVLRH